MEHEHKPDWAQDEEKQGPPALKNAVEIPTDSIQPRTDQPRKTFDMMELADLAASIEEHGVLMPLVVRPVAGQPQQWELVAGERRWRAATMAGAETIPAIVRDVSDDRGYTLSFVENVQRVQLTPIEEGRAILEIKRRRNWSWAQLEQALRKSRSWIRNRAALAELTHPDLEPLAHTEDGMSAARVLDKVSSPRVRHRLADDYMARRLNVREIEQEAAKYLPKREMIIESSPHEIGVPQISKREITLSVPTELTPFERGTIYLSHVRQAIAALEAARDVRQGHSIDPVHIKDIADTHTTADMLLSELKEIDRAQRMEAIEATG